ncbi:MAG: hypothetical protein K0S23_616 [Fluviicola sp.]|jgi:hypothetical protein|uniref:hypothetical protein n=1 Tax=Fluviicola sp. TaxID=1917219 RepID=UPI00261EF66E|nr:hypothetical protein [Fluviicola sp.]MDF3026309.1 hypothetical protein [Fluviicola sp.]
MKNKSILLTLICFGIILVSMFLPFYESPRSENLFSGESFVIVETYESSDFGVTFWVFNGFGSIFALMNLVIAIILLLSRFFFPRSFPTALITAFVFVISLLLLIYTTSENRGGTLQDEMLSGFYLMLICQVVLITQSFIRAITEPPKDRRTDSDILDF